MRHQEKVAKPPQRRRRGGRSQIMFRTQSETWCVSDHPVRDFGTGPFFDVASTPPFQGVSPTVRGQTNNRKELWDRVDSCT
jgi:hypothetical protein